MISSRAGIPMIGKLGNTVTYLLNGKLVTRTIGLTTRKPTIPKLAARMALTVIDELLTEVIDVINIGFKQEGIRTRTNAYNQAFSYNRINAIEGSYPDIKVNYPNVLLSYGKLMPVCNPVISVTATGLACEWDKEMKANKAHWSDTVMIIAYCPDLQKAAYLTAGAERYTGKDELQLYTMPHGHWLETYVSVISANHKNVSNSVYSGRHFW